MGQFIYSSSQAVPCEGEAESESSAWRTAAPLWAGWCWAECRCPVFHLFVFPSGSDQRRLGHCVVKVKPLHTAAPLFLLFDTWFLLRVYNNWISAGGDDGTAISTWNWFYTDFYYDWPTKEKTAFSLKRIRPLLITVLFDEEITDYLGCLSDLCIYKCNLIQTAV